MSGTNAMGQWVQETPWQMPVGWETMNGPGMSAGGGLAGLTALAPAASGASGINAPVAGAAGASGIPGMGQGPGGVGMGWNVGTGQLGLQGLNTLGNLYMAWQAQDLAKKTFGFNRDLANTNLNNSIRSYNTQLEDRARTRAFTEGGTGGFDEQAYLDRNRARR